MEISCNDCERLMDKVFVGTRNKKAYKVAIKVIKEHCKTCELCKIKFYNFGNTQINLSDERIEQIIEENHEVEKRAKIRKRITVVVSVLLSLAMLFGIFSYITIIGKNVFFASINYGVAETYTDSTPEHPSLDEVKIAVDKCKGYFERAGKGAVLLSLSYNDELTYSEGYEDTIVMDVVYYRMFVSKGTNGKTNFINDTYAILVKHDTDNDVWYAQKIKKIRE